MIDPTELELAGAFTLIKAHLPTLSEREVIIFAAACLAVARESFGTTDAGLLLEVEDVLHGISPVFNATH